MALREGWKEQPVDGMQESIDINNGTIVASRLFYGPWTDRYLFLSDFLPTIVSGGSSASAVRHYYPDIPHLLAYKADITGKLVPSNTGADEQIAYTRAEILVHYKSDPTTFFLTQGIQGQDNQPAPGASYNLRTTYSWDSVSQLITFKGKNVKDKDGQKQHDKGDFDFTWNQINIRVTYHDSFAGTNPSAFLSVGKINKQSITFDEMLGIFPVFPASTLRYEGCSGNQKISIREFDGTVGSNLVTDITYEITHNFLYNPLRWDRIPIGMEPVAVGQANPTPTQLVYQNVSKFLVADNSFADFLQHVTIS
jgi:hypothetical protein